MLLTTLLFSNPLPPCAQVQNLATGVWISTDAAHEAYLKWDDDMIRQHNQVQEMIRQQKEYLK